METFKAVSLWKILFTKIPRNPTLSYHY